MHMADALVSPPVAVTAGVAAVALLAVASRQVRKDNRPSLVPLMGVLGAFVFAAQMINFAIPGTGSSGHIIGGVLVAALVGPWAAFLTICSVLIIQCLIFADGGMLALGCNIINMAAVSTLVAYPFVYKPIARRSTKPWRLMLASAVACTVGLELGAFLVTMETEASGITALPLSTFLMFMLPIHLVIGLGEGLATGAVLSFVGASRPDLLLGRTMVGNVTGAKKRGRRLWPVLVWFGVGAVVMGVCFTWIASGDPDGLEWSIAKVAGGVEMGSITPPTAIIPDYESSFSGILGAVMVIVLLWALTSVIFRHVDAPHPVAEKVRRHDNELPGR